MFSCLCIFEWKTDGEPAPQNFVNVQQRFRVVLYSTTPPEYELGL